MLGMGADPDEIRALGVDSDSPPIVGDPRTGKHYVIGIPPQGYFPGRSAIPSSVALYINVTKHHEWITRTIANDTINLPRPPTFRHPSPNTVHLSKKCHRPVTLGPWLCKLKDDRSHPYVDSIAS